MIHPSLADCYQAFFFDYESYKRSIIEQNNKSDYKIEYCLEHDFDFEFKKNYFFYLILDRPVKRKILNFNPSLTYGYNHEQFFKLYHCINEYITLDLEQISNMYKCENKLNQLKYSDTEKILNGIANKIFMFQPTEYATKLGKNSVIYLIK